MTTRIVWGFVLGTQLRLSDVESVAFSLRACVQAAWAAKSILPGSLSERDSESLPSSVIADPIQQGCRY